MIQEMFVCVPLGNPLGAFVSCKGSFMLTDPHIKIQLREAVDSFCQQTFQEGPRGHLGASIIGKECRRALWYGFRFVAHKEHSGRIHRLFQRGHEEEPRVKRWLEGIGCVFQETGEKQLSFKALGGHFSGSCDGVLTLPEWCGYSQPILWENKTYGGEANDKKDFDKLFENGIQWIKPEHWAQMQVYMWKFGLEYALYTAVQKSTDEIYYEFVLGDPGVASDLQDKAQAIIFAESAPSKISTRGSADYRCRFCDFKEVCHLGKEILRNCRSCQNCKPVDNGGWECSLYGAVPKEHQGIVNECPQWKGVC